MINLKKQDNVADAVNEILHQEALKGNQGEIDANHNGKIDGEDFKLLRAKKKMKEGVEELDEKNVPSSPEKWAKAKAAAKSKFSVYPSAYANGWASKKYKSMGGSWHTEEVEQIDELSINTLTRVKHAATSAASDASREGDEGKATKRYDLAGKASNKIETKNRALGLKPSGQHAFEERHMTDVEMTKREKIVKSMKKGLSGFKERYGDRAKNVMYATANKQAMKD